MSGIRTMGKQERKKKVIWSMTLYVRVGNNYFDKNMFLIKCAHYLCRYWYKNGCLYPDMGTAFIAIDKCDVENGCLKVLE